MNSSKLIDISKSSLVGLKAELLKKQEEIKRIKEIKQDYVKPVVKPKKKPKSNTGVEERNLKDTESSEDFDALQKSREVLEVKARLYNKLKADHSDDTTKSKYLVDFDLKSQVDKQEEISENKNDLEDEEPEDDDKYSSDANSDPENDWVDFVDTLGRSRRCLRKDLSEMKSKDAKLATALRPPSPPPLVEPSPELLSWDMQREMMRKKWEEQEIMLLNKKDIHYQDIRFDEARSHGVGYFEFSMEESERIRQQEALKNMRKETEEQQSAAQGLRLRREQQLQARLAAARRRKRERLGLPPEEPEAELQEAEKEPLTEEPQKPEEIIDLEESIKKIAPVRPWDIGKKDITEVMSQEEWVEKKREERPAEFAPPTSLYNTDEQRTTRGKPGFINRNNLVLLNQEEKARNNVTSRVRNKERLDNESLKYNNNVEDCYGPSVEIRKQTSEQNNRLATETQTKNISYNSQLNVKQAYSCTDKSNSEVGPSLKCNSNEEDCYGPSVEAWKQTSQKNNVNTENHSREISHNSQCNERQTHSNIVQHMIKHYDYTSDSDVKQNIPMKNWKPTSEQIDELLLKAKSGRFDDSVTTNCKANLQNSGDTHILKSTSISDQGHSSDYLSEFSVMSPRNASSKSCNKNVVELEAYADLLNEDKFNHKRKNTSHQNSKCSNQYENEFDIPILDEIKDEYVSSASTASSCKTKQAKDSNQHKRKWAEIAPPASMDYYNSGTTHSKPNTSHKVNLADSISVGMNYLKTRTDEKGKKRIKGLLDIM